MKKGVSAVEATILMLMITIAIAGYAYIYLSGIFGVGERVWQEEDWLCVEYTTKVIENAICYSHGYNLETCDYTYKQVDNTTVCCIDKVEQVCSIEGLYCVCEGDGCFFNDNMEKVCGREWGCEYDCFKYRDADTKKECKWIDLCNNYRRNCLTNDEILNIYDNMKQGKDINFDELCEEDQRLLNAMHIAYLEGYFDGCKNTGGNV